MFRSLALIAVMLLPLVSLTACSGENHAVHNDAHDTHKLPNGDLQETTVSHEALPSFLSSQREEVRAIYKLAGQHAELLQWMPCYCGCADSAGHRSNLNCFIAKIEEDGSAVWDDHGTRCGVCLEIAIESIRLSKDGIPVKEIREYIDQKYESGYAAPTRTPIPG